MELIAAFWVLYGAQCFFFLPRGHVLFYRTQRETRGPGWRLAPPWPAAQVCLATDREPDLAGDDASDLARYRAERARVTEATHIFAGLSAVYATVLLLALPVAMAAFGSSVALPLALPGWALLHVATLIAYGISHARLSPDRRGERITALWAAALYPPLLLRACYGLRSEQLGSYPAVVVAAARQHEPARRAFLRAEFVRMAGGGWESARPADRARLRALARSVEERPELLFAIPACEDASASRYCPACHCDYREKATYCTDCRIELISYRRPVESSSALEYLEAWRRKESPASDAKADRAPHPW